jgi:acetyl esterase
MGDSPYSRTNLLPEVQQLIDASRAAKPADGKPTPIETMRALNLPTAAYFNAGAPAIALEREITIETPAAELRALVFAPEAEPHGLPVILHLHGGGFVFMLPDSFAKTWKETAIAANAIVVSLDYRLAPEHPYPAALDDCVAVYRWLRAHAAELGGDPQRVAIAGESAGGGLAASTVVRLLAEGDDAPAALVVASAWLDLRNNSPSFEALGPDDPFIDSATMAYWRGSYASRPEQWDDPLLSPVLADVSAFPPTCVVVAGIDPLHDDGVALAERMREAGREVELHDYPGMPHIFWCFPALHAQADVSARMAAFLRKRLG